VQVEEEEASVVMMDHHALGETLQVLLPLPHHLCIVLLLVFNSRSTTLCAILCCNICCSASRYAAIFPSNCCWALFSSSSQIYET
jgi:hypothetical protein